MSRVGDALTFVGQLMPSLVELGRDLFERYRGDVVAASAEIRRIRDHGAAFIDADARNRAELERLRDIENEDTKRTQRGG